jgi:hypothetical protein
MNEVTYWRQGYEMLMATFTEAVKAAIDANTAPRILADKESYNLGKLHGALEEREACAKWVAETDAEDWAYLTPEQLAEAILARK